MVFIVYGTTGELIKLVPLINELKSKCYTICLSQQEEQLQKFFKLYPQIPQPDLWLVRGHQGEDLSRVSHIPSWWMRVASAVAKNRRRILKHADPDKKKNILLVHGDTMTTVAGAYIGRLYGIKVGHIEAGLRSFKILHPFPEELDRRIVSRVAQVHFAPGDIPAGNLKKVKGEVINTGLNTVYDSVMFARNSKPAVDIENLPSKYGIVSIHRNELMANRKVFEQTLRTLAEYAAKTPLVFLKHPVTIERVKDLGLEDLLSQNFVYVPKLDYFSFIKLLDGSDYVVTDSGGLQEECTYIGKPCLIHRMATERQEGLKEGIVELSYFKDETLRRFLDRPGEHRHGFQVEESPTGVIVDYLKQHNYI